MYAKVRLRFAGGFTIEDAWIPSGYALIGKSISVVDGDKVWGCTITTVYPVVIPFSPSPGEPCYKEVIPF